MESPGLWLLLVLSIVLLFPLVFVGFWMSICSLLASLARWPALAARYPARGPAEGKPLRGEVTNVGAVRDRHVTILQVSPLGLHMAAWWPFKVRRAPVLVPWGPSATSPAPPSPGPGPTCWISAASPRSG